MDVRCQEFIDSLIALSHGLRAAWRETVEYWKPDEPPITTLFAAFGHRIAEDFDNVGADANRRVFLLIEKAMGSGHTELVTAVATGLIEALVAQAAQREGLWQRMSPSLGPLSLHHANAWLAT